MNQYVVLGIGLAAIWVIFMMTVGSKSTVWILKNRETLIGLSITSTVAVLIVYMFLINVGNLRSLYANIYIVIPLNFLAFYLLRVFVSKKKAPEERDLSGSNTKQYRVFDNIDLEDRFKERQGELITWNMGGDKAYEIINTDVEKIKQRVEGLRDVITDEIGFPIGIEITGEIKKNMQLLVDDYNNFKDIVNYKLTTNRSNLKNVKIYKNLLMVLQGVFDLYPKVLGELDFDQRIDKYETIELAFLDVANALSMKKIPINIVQLYAQVENDMHSDVLGAIKNIVQERTVQKEGIYLYCLFLLRYAQVNNKDLLDIIEDEVALANQPGTERVDEMAGGSL